MRTQGPRAHGRRTHGIRQPVSSLLAAVLLTGCLASESPPGGGGLGVPGSANTAPQISGDPQFVAVMSEAYLFTPSASDAEGDALTFTVRNKPAWSAFDAATGRLHARCTHCEREWPVGSGGLPRASALRCREHPGRPATSFCERCREGFCAACIIAFVSPAMLSGMLNVSAPRIVSMLSRICSRLGGPPAGAVQPLVSPMKMRE